MIEQIHELKQAITQYHRYDKEIKKMIKEQDKYEKYIDKKTPLLIGYVSNLLVDEYGLRIDNVRFVDNCLYIDFPVRRLKCIKKVSNPSIEKVVSLLCLSEGDYEVCVGRLDNNGIRAFEYLCVPLV